MSIGVAVGVGDGSRVAVGSGASVDVGNGVGDGGSWCSSRTTRSFGEGLTEVDPVNGFTVGVSSGGETAGGAWQAAKIQRTDSKTTGVSGAGRLE
jgi:hypothetical protein